MPGMNYSAFLFSCISGKPCRIRGGNHQTFSKTFAFGIFLLIWWPKWWPNQYHHYNAIPLQRQPSASFSSTTWNNVNSLRLFPKYTCHAFHCYQPNLSRLAELALFESRWIALLPGTGLPDGSVWSPPAFGRLRRGQNFI